MVTCKKQPFFLFLTVVIEPISWQTLWYQQIPHHLLNNQCNILSWWHLWFTPPKNNISLYSTSERRVPPLCLRGITSLWYPVKEQPWMCPEHLRSQTAHSSQVTKACCHMRSMLTLTWGVSFSIRLNYNLWHWSYSAEAGAQTDTQSRQNVTLRRLKCNPLLSWRSEVNE